MFDTAKTTESPVKAFSLLEFSRKFAKTAESFTIHSNGNRLC